MMSVRTRQEGEIFASEVTEMMHRIEDLSHFALDRFFSFEYLQHYVTLLNPTYEELIGQWHTTLTSHTSILTQQTAITLLKINRVTSQKKNFEIIAYVPTRVRLSLASLTFRCLFYSSTSSLRD